MALTTAQRGKVRRLSQPKELSPDEEGGELNIVPFLDIVMNILIFVLATVAVTFTATITTTPPKAGGGGVVSQSESLNLTVFIVNDGFAVKGKGGSVAPGCESLGEGMTVPKAGGRYDFAGLTACAAKLKNSSEKFREETQAFITGNPDVDYQTIVSTMDALQGPGAEPLFEEFNFKLVK